MKQQLLLLEDVDGLGKSGEIVFARPGFIRNFLLPKKKAIIADKNTLRMQNRLQEKRREKAIQDLAISKEIAAILKDYVMEFYVKVDPEGNMYGSVTIIDLMKKAEEKGLALEKKNFPSPNFSLRELGNHKILLKLKEGEEAVMQVNIVSEAELA